MGVRGLMTYLQNYCPKACYEVHIGNLVDLHRQQTGRQAEIVVDAQSCFQMWCGDLDWTIGLQVQEIIDRIRKFIASFKLINVNLVFFIGGLTPPKKRNTWLRRRVWSMRKMMNVWNWLYNNQCFEDFPPPFSYIPPNIGNFIAFVLKYVLQCQVYVTIHECDEEIVDYVCANNCFAIFAHDTDFIVSCVKECVVLSAKDFNIESMTTQLFNRHELSNYLGIEVHQLPLVAILAGNDIVDPESLKPFHFRVCNWHSKKRNIPYNVLMPSLGAYINKLPQNISVNNLMRMISYHMFDHVRKAILLRTAYSAYFACQKPDFFSDNYSWSQILNEGRWLLQNVQLPVSAWGVLSQQVYESSPCLEDLRKYNDYNENVAEQPSTTITRPLRERMYGILLFEIRYSRPVVKEWCGENLGSYRKPVFVNPVYPREYHPGLRVLWNPNQTPRLILMKWKLFLGAVSPYVKKIYVWMSLPNDMVISAATCRYLYEAGFLYNDELRAILATLVMYHDYDSSKLKRIRYGSPNFRAIQISVAFSRTHSLIFSLFASCGYPVPLSTCTSHIKFEPKLFQMIFGKVNRKARLGELCDNNIKAMNIFHQMKYAVYYS